MKKVTTILILLLIGVSGMLLTNCENKNEPSKKSTSKPLSAAERKAELKKWEATQDGKKFKEWKMSNEGKKVLADAAKISKQIKTSTNIEAVVTSLSLPAGSQLGFGVMVRINDADYILSFGLEQSNEFEQLRNLKVNDKITIRSHNVSYAPKYSYPIIAGNYVEQNSKMLFKRDLNKNNRC